MLSKSLLPLVVKCCVCVVKSKSIIACNDFKLALEMLKSIVEEGENVCYRVISLFSTMFSEAIFCMSLKKGFEKKKDKSSTLYHTISTFNDPAKAAFLRKHFWKRRKCWFPAFFSLPTTFSTHPQKNFCF